MSWNHFLRIFIALFTLTLCFTDSSQAQEEIRSWTAGKFSLEAKFVALKDEVVTLEKPDGQQVKIGLDKLSFDDQKLALKLSLKSSTPSGKPDPKMEEVDPTSGPKIITPRWRDVKILNPSKAEGWNVEADPPPEINTSPAVISLPAKRDFFEKDGGMFINSQTGIGCATWYKDDDTRLEIFDLKQGKQISSALLPLNWGPIAISDTDKQVVLISHGFGFGKKERLTVWNYNDASATPLRGWVCSPSTWAPSRDIKWGVEVANQQFATLTNDGRLTIWDYIKGQPKCYLDMGRNGHAEVSPGGRYILCGIGSDLVVIDTTRRNFVGKMEIPDAIHQQVHTSFSPDGSQFAFGYGSILQIHDFLSGRMRKEIVAAAVTGKPVWTDDKHVLIGSALIDLENEFRLWTYNGANQATYCGGKTWCLVGDRNSMNVVGVTLPHLEAKSKAAEALKDPNFFAVKPGSVLKLNLDGITETDKRQEIEESLQKRFEELGFEVSASADIEVVGSVKRGKTEEITFVPWGTPFWSDTAGDKKSVTEWVCRLTINANGKEVWQSAAVTRPTHITLQDGESLDSALQRLDKPNYRIFTNATVPRYIPRDGSASGLGTSSITSAGVR